jgi:DNA-binding transcriptional LysR family regulator
LDPQTHHQIEGLFLRKGAVMNIVLEVDSLLSMINFVAIGSGCALLPDYLRAIHREGIVYKRLRSPHLVKTMAIAKKKDKTGLAEAFYGFTVDSLREGGRPGAPRRGRAQD